MILNDLGGMKVKYGGKIVPRITGKFVIYSKYHLWKEKLGNYTSPFFESSHL